MNRIPLCAALAAMLLTGAAGLADEAAPASPFAGTGDLAIDKPEDKVDVPPVPAPAGAIVIFNGQDVSDWTSKDGGECKWNIVDGVLQGKPGAGDILTKHQFEGGYKLHVEFRVPYEPDNHSQGRGNSGVYLNSHWEVQVLDSYHNETYADGACGAIYSIEPPMVNAARAPTVWQAYDIEFHPAKCESGKVVERPTVTVIWNGVKVHDHTKLTKDSTPAGNGGDICQPGPLKLQDHGHPVQFRNIWTVPLKQ